MRALLNGLTGSLAAVTLGIWMNFAAMLANGWRMPEFAPGDYPGYVDGLSARLAFLGDWIQVADFWLSPGDVLLFGGGAIMFICLAGLTLMAGRYRAWHWRVG